MDTRRSIRTRTAACVLLVAGAFASHAAFASNATTCVSNNTEFKAALATAQFVPTTIQMVRGGNYDFAHSVWDGGWNQAQTAYIRPGSALLGGYSAGCASRNIDVSNTVVGYSNANGAGAGISFSGDLKIEGLTFSTGLTFAGYYDTDGNAQPDPELLIRRDAFLGDSTGIAIYWSFDEDFAGTIRVVDTLIADLTQTTCSLYIDIGGSPAVQLIHNTIYSNSGGDAQFGSGVCMLNDGLEGVGSGTLVAYNNILHGNSNRDFYTDDAVFAPFFVDNVMGPHHTPGAVEFGTLDVNPRLDGNYRPIESPPSPVINTGSNTVPGGLPGTDLPGRNRVIGSAPDRGAFESTVDDSFLQTVSTTSDSGVGSLRSAISGANAHGSGLITFDLGTGCGPHVITLNSALPTITAPIIINGYSQPGSSANDLDIGDDATFCVILESGDASVTRGLVVPASAGDGVSLFVEGLAFSNFSDTAIDLGSGTGHIVVGNRFGGSAGGHTLQPNGIGVQLDAAAHDSTIGGDDNGDRNILSSSTGSGVALFQGAHGNQIIGNLIGVGWSGDASGHFTNLGNGTRGIYLAGHDNEISGNWIGDNAQSGIAVANGGATGNTIENNQIGFLWGTTGHGNGQAGVHFSGSAGDAPGPNTVRFNTITYNATQGVWVAIGQGNKIRRNGVAANGGLGIDLAGSGVLPNDDDAASQPPDYANRGVNFPVLTSAIGGDTSGTFTGSLESTLGDHRIDFYQTSTGCDPDDNRQAEFWIGSAVITISTGSGGEGVENFSVMLDAGDFGTILGGAGITATATDSAGNTSELSGCVVYSNDTIFADGFDP